MFVFKGVGLAAEVDLQQQRAGRSHPQRRIFDFDGLEKRICNFKPSLETERGSGIVINGRTQKFLEGVRRVLEQNAKIVTPLCYNFYFLIASVLL